jgi:uncharacterized protein
VGYEREHTPGTPTWIDLTSPDLVISARFYGGLLGWDTALRGPADLTGGYLTFKVEGLDVAGLGRLAGDDEPPAWTTYIAVRDIDETAAAVAQHGGNVLQAPTDVHEAGRSALFTDPTGAVFGAWQPGEHQGAQLIGDPGTMCWNQLASRNIESAKRFYGGVFGWIGTTVPYETSTYTTFRLDGREVVGMIEMDRSWPRGLPSHWMTYLRVDDCDKAAALAVELGGEVLVEPDDMPQIGRLAVLGDPYGAVFSILAPNDHVLDLYRRRTGEVPAVGDDEDEAGAAVGGRGERELIEIPDDPLEIDVDEDVAIAAKRKSA